MIFNIGKYIMSLIHLITPGTADVKTVKRIQFSLLSPETILSESVASIHKHITKGGEYQNTLMDPRLGASRAAKNAVTGLSIKTDPGNFGHCPLTLPVYHPIYYDNVKNILKIICPVCSSFRTHPDCSYETLVSTIKRKGIVKSKRATYIHTELLKGKAKTCQVCKASLPDVVTDNANQVLGFALSYIIDVNSSFYEKDKNCCPIVSKDKGKKEIRPIYAKRVFDILKRISDVDASIMGYNPEISRPEWMMITILPIPPPTVRPSVVSDDDKTSDDDITQALHNIIKFNNSLAHALDLKDDDKDKEKNTFNLWKSLQLHVAALIDNESNSYPKVCNRAHRPLKTIKGRHKGKPGRVRNNLEGKRTNYSSRTVITADPNLSINQVGVPIEIAMVLTYEETVNKYNVRQLTTLVRRGADVYPGANEYKLPGQNYPINLSCKNEGERQTIKLPYGSKVYRHMLDGDIVIFNRQPSLHKMNMMGHYAVILPGRSFRLAVNATQPYGADFDGDEMNLHFPQTEQGRREWELLALSPTQMVSPQANKPVIGAVQDTMLATYRASSEHIRGYANDERYVLNISEFMHLVNWISDFRGHLPPIQKIGSRQGWTMIDLINLFLPPITVKKSTDKGKLHILNGKLQEPQAGSDILPMAKDTSMLSTSAGSLFHIAWNDLGPKASHELLDNLSRIMSQWFMISGFSVGLKDLEIPSKYTASITASKISYLAKAHTLLDKLHNDEYTDALRNSKEFDLGPRGLVDNDYEQFEIDIGKILTQCRDTVQAKVAEHIDELETEESDKISIYDNRFMSMVRSGSKGKPTNAVQIIGILGQQDIGGSRVKDYYRRRPLPFVPKDDLSPSARGFIVNSFISGLTFLEYIYHAMAGRMGVISTSIKTAETGYLQRKLVKRLEDIMTHYDGTVRLGNGVIVQSIYGGDGYDGTKIEKQRIAHIAYSLDELHLKYNFTKSDWNDYQTISKVTQTSGDVIQLSAEEIAEEQSAVAKEVQQLEDDWKYLRRRYQYDLPESIPSIINFDRLIDSVQSKLLIAGSFAYPVADWVLKPSYIRKRVEALTTELRLPTVKSTNDLSLKQFFVLLRSKLSSRFLILEKGYNINAFHDLLAEIKYKFYDGIITPGEAVGALAAQSIGEPSTQMTLDAFHSTGSKVTVSGGVPRFKEILSLTKMKTPSATIFLKGIPVPEEIMEYIRTHSSVPFMPDQLSNSIYYVDKWLSTLEYEEAVELKTKFVNIYTGGSVDVEGELNVLKVKNCFEHAKLSDVISHSDIYYVHDAESHPYATFDIQSELEYPIWIIVMHIDKDVISHHGIDPQELVARIDDNSVQYIAGEEVLIFPSGANSVDIDLIMIKETRHFEKHIKGVSGIGKTVIRREPRDIYLENGSIIQKSSPSYDRLSKIMLSADDYIVDTIGSNLLDIMAQNNVDPYKTYTNDIIEMYNIYGIEVARRSIIRETYDVLKNAGAAIDVRHIELLADAMTCRGFLQKIDRYGARKGESGPLAMASFEETTSVLCEAAAFAQEDNMNGVSANVMFGQFIKLGTNSFDVYLDEAMILEHAEADPYEEIDLNADIDVASHFDDAGCKESDFQFDFVL